MSPARRGEGQTRGHACPGAGPACAPFLLLGSPRVSPRLRHTKEAVKAALADDFDTPAAVDAVMELVHHGNRQLKAHAQVCPGTARGVGSCCGGFRSPRRHSRHPASCPGWPPGLP